MPDTDATRSGPPDDIVYPDAIPFILVHLACFAAIWTGVGWADVALCAALFYLRMFAVTAGYHRYFAHRTYKTSRLGQFVLACLSQSSTHKGVIWWSATHRHHHRHSDTAEDVHSPLQHGFFFSHVGWIFSRSKGKPDYSRCKDLTRYPELVWLDRYQNVPAVALALVAALIGGWSGLVVGFFWSTVLLYHATFSINSVAHVAGKRRYITGDDSRNNFWLALLTMGEGWHNNHHYYQSSTRQGFRWWEIDMTYYLLKVLSWFKIVWGLRKPPKHVIEGDRPVPSVIVDKVAHQLASTFSAKRISKQLADAWHHTPGLEDLMARAHSAQKQASEYLADYLAEVHLPDLPHWPSKEEFRRRAQDMFAYTQSLDAIAERAQEILLRNVSVHLLEARQA